MHVCVQVQIRDVVGRSRFNPHALPDTTARCIEYVRLRERLLPDWNHIWIRIRRIENEDQQLVRSSGSRQVVRDIEREGKIPASMLTHALAIDEDGSLVIDGSKVEKHPIARRPVCGHSKRSRKPGVDVERSLDACTIKSAYRCSS